MKAKQRHQLKQNDFAESAMRVAGVITEHRRRIVPAVVAALVVIAGASGYFVWRKGQADKAGALLGTAMAISQAQIAPPSTLPGAAQSPGTYPTDKARSEAALKAFQEVVSSYPSTQAAVAARYRAAGELLALGRAAEAEREYRAVAADGGAAVYQTMAQMGLAEALAAEGKADDAIKTLTDLSGQRDSVVPVDGVLMQLAQMYEHSGKTQEAKATFKRVVDEFPDSGYAPVARQEMAAIE
jgi:predicted negative regulator of RcsB-dependent stress response